VVWVALGLAALLVVVAYWQLIIAEGAYLGPKVVALLYDWSARRYDHIKQFEPIHDDWFLALPLLYRLRHEPSPLVLDVATGTARLPLALLRRPDFQGQVVGLDISGGMLREARCKTRIHNERVLLVQQDAMRLPFADNTFHAVTCLEALEFLPDLDGALREMVRVLQPGGTLLITNRVGREAWLLPGRALRPRQLEALLAALPLTNIRIRPWQVYYDLIWAEKEPGLQDSNGSL